MSTNVYCKYCGAKYSSIASLTAQRCSKHPLGTHNGNHALYEGAEKSNIPANIAAQCIQVLLT